MNLIALVPLAPLMIFLAHSEEWFQKRIVYLEAFERGYHYVAYMPRYQKELVALQFELAKLRLQLRLKQRLRKLQPRRTN